MKKTIKSLVLVAIMTVGILVPMTINAQSDGFFRDGGDGYNDRAVKEFTVYGNSGTGITNNGIGQNEGPLGSGLLIMMVAGAGYAISRCKRNRKGVTMILALALILGMTQCKKNVETISNTNSTCMHITLNVGDDSKVQVTPGFYNTQTGETYAAVTFQEDDLIYVGYNGKLVGHLSYSGGDNYFKGDIYYEESDLSSDDYLHFYFLGNKEPYENDAVGVTSLSVNIIDQTIEYPVISYAHSTVIFDPDNHSYQAHLLNYCAIQKFTTNLDKVVKLKGMKNKVTVDFSNRTNPFLYSQVANSEGAILLHREGDTERWAIVLPQEAITAASASAVGYGTASTFGLHKIERNGYYDDAISISMVRTGYVDGKISVAQGKQIYAAAGNLQYIGSETTVVWKFADNQWDMIGTSQGTAVANANRDLFGWGTSGYNGKYPYMTSTTNTDYPIPIVGTNYDWGIYHSPESGSLGGGVLFANGGGLSWRKSTMLEGEFFSGAVTESYGIRVKEFGTGNWQPLIGWGIVNGVKGLLILPDNWDGSMDPEFVYNSSAWANEYDETTTPRWSAMEAYGVAFFPCAGYRDGTTVTYAGERGGYWSSDAAIYGKHGLVLHDETWTLDPDTKHELRGDAFVMKINEPKTIGTSVNVYWMDYRYRGMSVRLCHEIPTSGD